MGLKISGTKNIKFGNDVYLLKKGNNFVVLEEAPDGEIEVDFSEFFENYQRWDFGIKTERWYSVFVNAIAFKIPHLVWEEDTNFLLSISPKKDGRFAISGIVFAPKPEEAIDKAFEFKKLNREYIAFEVAPRPSTYPLKISKADLNILLSQILKELKEIKEIATLTYEETKEVKDISVKSVEIGAKILDEILSLKNAVLPAIEQLNRKAETLEVKVQLLEQKVENLPATTVQLPSTEKKTASNEIEVIVVSDRPVSEGGFPVALPNPLEEVVEFLEPKIEAFASFYRIDPDLAFEKEEELRKLIRRKYLKGETTLSYEEVKTLLGIDPPVKKSWRIVLTIKEKPLKQLIKAVRETLSTVPLFEVEKAIKCAFKHAISKGSKVITAEDLKKCFAPKFHPKIDKLFQKLELLKEGEPPNNRVFIPEKQNSLLLLALDLEAKKKGKKLVIKEV